MLMNRDQLKKLEGDLWSAADKLRANSDLKASEYSTPVLGLIFLKFVDNKYRQHEDAILADYQKFKGTRRERSLQDGRVRQQALAHTVVDGQDQHALGATAEPDAEHHVAVVGRPLLARRRLVTEAQ